MTKGTLVTFKWLMRQALSALYFKYLWSLRMFQKGVLIKMLVPEAVQLSWIYIDFHTLGPTVPLKCSSSTSFSSKLHYKM